MDTVEMSETGHVVGGELGCQVETGEGEHFGGIELVGCQVVNRGWGYGAMGNWGHYINLINSRQTSGKSLDVHITAFSLQKL